MDSPEQVKTKQAGVLLKVEAREESSVKAGSPGASNRKVYGTFDSSNLTTITKSSFVHSHLCSISKWGKPKI